MQIIKPAIVVDQLIDDICSLTQTYNDIIKSGRPFSEAKKVRHKIKQLVDELKDILSEDDIVIRDRITENH